MNINICKQCPSYLFFRIVKEPHQKRKEYFYCSHNFLNDDGSSNIFNYHFLVDSTVIYRMNKKGKFLIIDDNYKSKRKDMNAYILKKLQKHPCLKGCLYQPEQELYELYGKDIIQST